MYTKGAFLGFPLEFVGKVAHTEMPCWCPFEEHNYGRRKPTETSVFEISYLCVNSLPEELIEIKVILILRRGMFR